jgi:cell division protein FtsW (lipid II flippase)
LLWGLSRQAQRGLRPAVTPLQFLPATATDMLVSLIGFNLGAGITF